MSASASEPTLRYCGRHFSADDIETIRRLIASNPQHNRARLSRLVCQELGWRRPDGRGKDMSCRVAMLRMQRDGWIVLPPPQKGNGNGRRRPRLTAASEPADPISLPAKAAAALRLQPVNTPRESVLWNELIERYHYLGYQPLPGAQMRYLVYQGPHLLAVLGFGAAAWKVAPRDRFIGWSPEQRAVNLRQIVNNARFLILPWITAPNLASRVLAAAAKRVVDDWPYRYGYELLLLETFVERNRFRGTAYRAANWIHVGHTQGRGKLDRHHRHSLPVKDIFLYPLRRDFRRKLRTQSETST